MNDNDMKLKAQSIESNGDWTVSVKCQDGGQRAGHPYRVIRVRHDPSGVAMEMAGTISFGGYRSHYQAIKNMKAAIELVQR